MAFMINLDEFAFIIFLVCISLYIFLLIYSITQKKPSQRNVFNLIYKNWVDNRLKDDEPLVGIQALRNFIMSNSIFITALLILLGLLIGIYSSYNFKGTTFLGFKELSLDVAKIVLNIFMIIFCLFNFILCIRMLNRTSLLLCGNPQEYSIGKYKGLELIQKSFISAQNHWMYGIRGLFYLIATLFWLINTILFMACTIIVTLYLILFQDIWRVGKHTI